MIDKILVTGATGLIGYSFIRHLFDTQSIDNSFQICGLVRDIKKAERLYKDLYPSITFIVGDIADVEIEDTDFTYIIHAASCTSSISFVSEPVKVIMTNVSGTYRMLELARRQTKLKRFVFLSTMEVYGTPLTDEKISEDYGTNINTKDVRACYPESKRLCENLCIAYHSQFTVPVNIMRLTQTFGPGVQYGDKRVFAEFARCAIEGKDIILHTKGEKKRSYLYTEDAAKAILCVMRLGVIGEVYNIANEKTYCSIFDMAVLVAQKFAAKKIHVMIMEKDTSSFGFAPTLHMNLDTTKIRKLGWRAETGLEDMFGNMIKYMKSDGQGKQE